jgi:hypothetical protein
MQSVSRLRFASILAALAAVAVTAACGGDDEFLADAAGPEVDSSVEPDGPTADAAPVLDSNGDSDPGPPGMAFVAAGDFVATGVVGTIALADLTVTPNAVAGVAGPDPFVRQFGDDIYIINRSSGENITIVNRDTLTLVDQFATGAGSNPQDVAVLGDKLYVAGLALDHILVIDTTDRSTSEIDLSSLDAVDDVPDCISVYLVGTTLYAVCGILDETFQPRGNGKVAVIDTADDTLADSFDLDAENPIGQLQPFGDDLLIGTVPSYTDFATGCLDLIQTGPTPSASCLVANADLDGFANRYQSDVAGETLWINVNAFDESFNAYGSLIAWDIAASELADTALTPGTQIIGDLAVCPDGHLVAADTTFGAAGIRVYNTAAELTTDPLDIGAVPNYGNNMTCW